MPGPSPGGPPTMRLRRRHPRPTGAPEAAPPAAPTCQAPHSMLRFTPDGRVLACCANSEYLLGQAGRQTIREIWDGVKLARLRTALDELDYSLGCQDCGADRALGNRDRSIE